MKLRALLLTALSFSGILSAQAATNLAVVCLDSTKVGARVDAGCATQVYRTPLPADLVRVSPTNVATWDANFTFARYDSLAVGKKFEACLDDKAENSKVEEPWCSAYPFIAKKAAPSTVDTAKVVDGLLKLQTAAEGIDARTSSTLLVAHRKLIKDGLVLIGDADIAKLLTAPVVEPEPEVSVPPVVVPPVVGAAGTITLRWTPPTQNTDGSALTNLAGYEIRHGPVADQLTSTIAVGPVSTYTVTGLPAGVRHFVVLAKATSGALSLPSNAVTVTIANVGVPLPLPAIDLPGGSATGVAKKWNPGMYVRCNCLGWNSSREGRHASYARIRNESTILGAAISIPWGVLEPQKGQYDFSEIDADLALMKSMGKRLIIEPWWQNFNPNPRDTRYFPQYIIDEGGVGTLGNPVHETHINMNEAKWQTRYFLLQQALAARYDADPAVEQIAFTETASSSAYGFLTLVPRVAALWPKTTTVLYANWVDSPELARDLLAMLNRIGAGIGAPDIIGPPGFNYEDHGSQALRGKGRRPIWGGDSPVGDFGTIDYRGKIPVAYQYQALNAAPASSIIEYAINELRVTHIVWSMTDDGNAADWKYTLPVIKANASRIVKAYPTSMPRN